MEGYNFIETIAVVIVVAVLYATIEYFKGKKKNGR